MIIMIRYRLRGLSRSVHEQGSTSVVPRGDFLGDEGGIEKAQIFWKIVWICRTTRQCDGLSTFQGSNGANFRHRYLLNNVFQNSGRLDMGYGYGSEQAKTKHPKSQRSLEFNTLYICIYVYFIYIMYVLYSTVHISHSRNMYSTIIPYCIPKQESFIPTAAF